MSKYEIKALVEQFNISADRLTTDGFGDKKPTAPNNTPQGRAENRRVEFNLVRE